MKHAISFSGLIVFGVVLLAAAAIPITASAATENGLDLAILGGRVIDPASGLDAERNIAIRDGEIVAVTTAPVEARRVIDATGLVVAPGFIDLHAHGQSLMADRMQAFDGVTTSLELESGILPVGDWYEAQARTGRLLNYGTSAAWTFARIAEFEDMKPRAELTWFQQAFAKTHWVDEPASKAQTGRIVASIEEGLEEGALGIGINAGYAPGGGFRELLAVHQLAARHSVPTFTHISCDSPYDPDSAAECVGQVIALAATTNNHAHICHLNSSSGRAVDVTSEMLRKAQDFGIPLSTEAYTYGASSTVIGSALFSDEAMAAKGIEPEDIEFNGKRLDEKRFRTLRAGNPGAVVVLHFLDMPEEQDTLDQSVLFPGGAIASDAMPWIDRETGELADVAQWPPAPSAFAHPRSAGTFTRLLARWVREGRRISLLDAVRKASLIPAEILESSVGQLRKKGRLQPGMDADLIVFDLSTVEDRATFTEPAQPARGMQYVLVNGEPVIDRGELQLDVRPGRAIRRVTASPGENDE